MTHSYRLPLLVAAALATSVAHAAPADGLKHGGASDVAAPAASQPAAPGTSGGAIGAAALDQITEIVALKATFSPAERKLSSGLVFRGRAAAGQAIGNAARGLNIAMDAGPATPVEVDLAGTISAPLLGLIRQHGGVIENSHPEYGRMRLTLPLGRIAVIAAHPDVRWIREADRPQLQVGSLTTQGYVTHRAKEVVQGASPITGAGVKVGVISDSASASRVSALIASGDLGANTSVLEASSGSDEGTAMMEIVQDIAPGAQVYFATGNGGEAHFASNIAALATAGCSIIVDDLSYFAEPAFQDGVVAQAVNTFVGNGGIYFSSAANSGNLTSGTSGTWEGDYLAGVAATSPIPEAGTLHNFGTGGSPQYYDALTAGTGFITLKWSDPQGASTSDYDLFVLNSAGTVVKASSLGSQNGTQNPYESVSLGDPGFVSGDRIVILNFNGAAAARALRVDTHRGQLAIATAGSTFGHNGGQNTQSVAAVPWNGAPKIGTVPFLGTSPFEVFSSDGPRKIFYNPNGTAITAGNVLFNTNGGTTLAKPDFAAADGTSGATPGFLPFFGTSAAAPHAAGIAALVKSAKPTLTGAQIRTILVNTAIDVAAPGVDRDTGAGVLMAKPAVDAALAP